VWVTRVVESEGYRWLRRSQGPRLTSHGRGDELDPRRDSGHSLDAQSPTQFDSFVFCRMRTDQTGCLCRTRAMRLGRRSALLLEVYLHPERTLRPTSLER